jgi:hypothetical protein
MKFYTSIKSIPELSDLPDVWRKHSWPHYGFIALFNWKTLLTFVLCSPIFLGALKLRYYLEDHFPDINEYYFILPLNAISFLVVYFIWFQVAVNIVRPYIAEDRANLEKQ